MSQAEACFWYWRLQKYAPGLTVNCNLPKAWFEESHAELRNKTGVPEYFIFQTKPELGWPLI